MGRAERKPAGQRREKMSAAPRRDSKKEKETLNGMEQCIGDCTRNGEEEEGVVVRQVEWSGVWESSVKVASPWKGCAIWMRAVVRSKVCLCSRLDKCFQRHRPRPCPLPQRDIIGRLVARDQSSDKHAKSAPILRMPAMRHDE